jgi:hypothetical protein
MSTTREKWLALVAYSLVFLFALTGVWVFHRIIPITLRAVHHLSGEPEAFPAGFRLLLGLEPYAILLPIMILVLGLLSWRFRMLRHAIVLSLLGSIVGLLFLGGALLLATPYFLYAGLPSVTPEMAEQLLSAGEITLFSLDPEQSKTEVEKSDAFQGYPVYGKVRITDLARKSEIIEAIIKGTDHNTGVESLCFTPHHGLRIVSRGKTFDYSLCFQCCKLYYHATGEFYFISGTPMETLNQAMREAGIQLETDSAPEAKNNSVR